MTIRSYDELYLEGAMFNLGEAFDYAVNLCGLDIDEFADIFITGEYAKRFACGEPKIVAGLSGTELVMEMLPSVGINLDFPPPSSDGNYSREFWVGWVIAYYQWRTGVSFKEIFSFIKASKIREMYTPFHEAGEENFVCALDEMMSKEPGYQKLAFQRKVVGYSQRKLAQKAGVNLRTLQQYESGAKDLNKASVETVLNLAWALGCDIEDILYRRFDAKISYVNNVDEALCVAERGLKKGKKKIKRRVRS